jgi:hypothetical protein
MTDLTRERTLLPSRIGQLRTGFRAGFKGMTLTRAFAVAGFFSAGILLPVLLLHGLGHAPRLHGI